MRECVMFIEWKLQQEPGAAKLMRSRGVKGILACCKYVRLRQAAARLVHRHLHCRVNNLIDSGCGA